MTPHLQCYISAHYLYYPPLKMYVLSKKETLTVTAHLTIKHLQASAFFRQIKHTYLGIKFTCIQSQQFWKVNIMVLKHEYCSSQAQRYLKNYFRMWVPTIAFHNVIKHRQRRNPIMLHHIAITVCWIYSVITAVTTFSELKINYPL